MEHKATAMMPASSPVQRRKRLAKAIMVFASGLLILCAATISSAKQGAATPATAPSSGTPVTGGADLVAADGPVRDGKLTLTVNKSAVVSTRAAYRRVSVGNPDIADVNTIGPGSILVTAKKPGNTQLIVWDDNERAQVIEVVVNMDMDSLQGQLRAMFPNTTIEVAQLNGAIALRGRVPNLDVAEQAAAVASPFAPKVLNLMEISGGQQVMLKVRFAEVSRSATSQLGINYNYASGSFVGGSNIGQVNPSSRMPSQGVVGQSPSFNGVDLGGATPVNPSVTLYGAGEIGNFYFEYFIQALRQNNLLRVLAEPTLMATSGQEAMFLAGGEFPVPVTQGGGGAGGVAVTVEYREYGVRLKFVPIVTGNGRIKLKVAPEVSDLDFTTAVRFNGFVIPGLISRRVETTIELADGQSFAIAGLLNNTIVASKDVTPGLGDLPIVGALFRSVRYQRKETELVVLVTPHLVDALNPGQVPNLPGEHWRNPTENELFWNRDLGGEMPDKRRAPATRPVSENSDALPARFVGSYGFAPATQGTESVEGARTTGEISTTPSSSSGTTSTSAGGSTGEVIER